MLAAMRERFLVEGPEDDVDLLFEQLAVGGLVEQWRAEGFDFSRVIAAPDPENDASAGQDIRRGVILDQSQRVPHRGDIEAAAELQTLGDVGEVERRHQDIRDALVAFVLKMVLGHPERIVADAIHQLGHRLGLVENAGELFVPKATVVHRSAAVADIVQVDVSSEQAVEFRNHAGPSTGILDRASTRILDLRSPEATRNPRVAAPARRDYFRPITFGRPTGGGF
jgi:hypothetical protein